MVQILPPKTSLGNQFGQSVGSGLSSGIQQANQVQFQRGMLKEALRGLDKLPPTATSLEKTKYLIEATAGLPDQGRVLQALSPMLIGQGRNENIFGAGTPGGLPAQGGGHLPPIPTEQDVHQFAVNYAQQHQKPGAYQEGRAIAESQQTGAKGAHGDIRTRAIQEVPELKAHPERIPLFMQEAQKIADEGETDINKILQKSRENFRTGINRDLDILHNGYVPGPLRGALKKAKGLVGITSAFAQGGQTRDEAVKSLSGSVKRLIDKGHEAEVRTILSQEHQLSPTEIEEVIHPLNEKTTNSINSLPVANKIPQASHAQTLDKFLDDNLSKDESVLAIRHRLWDEKGYDWKEVAEALKRKESKMSEFQKREMQTVENDPPIQSLSDIFRGWDRFVNYLSGAK